MQWRAFTQEKPEPGARSHEGLETGELVVEAPDVDAAMTMFDEQLPTSWRVLSVQRVG